MFFFIFVFFRLVFRSSFFALRSKRYVRFPREKDNFASRLYFRWKLRYVKRMCVFVFRIAAKLTIQLNNFKIGFINKHRL